MTDPVMQGILKQGQEEPQSMIAHMANPDVKAKIEKLIKAVRFFFFSPSSTFHSSLI